jgi:DNA repair photolyase
MPLKTTTGKHGGQAKGRGATINLEGRYEAWSRDAEDDGWFQEPEEGLAREKTVVAIERAKSIISRNDSPDVGFSQSINPYRGCEHACSYCLWGGTPILMADGRTLPLSELRPGDEIYGTRRDGFYRRYVKSRVLAHWSSIKRAFRITLEDGTELVTSGDHRFLSDRGWRHVVGAEQGPLQRPHLTLANKLMGTGKFPEAVGPSDDYRRGYLCGIIRGDAHLGQHVCRRSNGREGRLHQFRLAPADPQALLQAQEFLLDWDIATREFRFQAAGGSRREMHAIGAGSIDHFRAIHELIAWPNLPLRDWPAGFLAGIFDAGGSFSQTAFRIPNTDPEVIGWIERCLRMFGFRFVVEHQHHEDRKPIDVVRLVGGLGEHLRFFHTFRPAITRELDIEGQAIESDAKLRVVAIEPLGKAMRLYDITTETGDFIANGVVSHNCYARPSHAYLGLSPGLDFETRLFAKTNAAELLREELSKPGYKCTPIAIGVNTDAYQPIERDYKVTRSILEVVHEAKQPVHLISKSALVERDMDLLVPMAKERLVTVTLSVTTLDNGISRRMEPRASAPARRLKAIERLAAAGIPVTVNVAPVVPFLTDSEMEAILEAAAKAGALGAGYQLMRLPWEVKDVFKAWLEANFPLKAAHVMSRVHEMREGRDNDPGFGTRMRGTGLFAELLRRRYQVARDRLGLVGHAMHFELDTTLFRPPSRAGQGSLF